MITAATKVLGIIGNPISASFSPVLQNELAKSTSVDVVYLPFLVEKDLESAIKGIRDLNIAGVNITIPYKRAVLDYVDELDKKVLALGAANTIKNNDGRLTAYNTDVDGLLLSLSKNGIDIAGKRVLVLGSGGAARAVLYAAMLSRAKSLSIATRDKSRAKETFSYFDFAGVPAKFLSYDELAGCYDVVFNATPVGMYLSEENVFENYVFLNGATAFVDLVYGVDMTVGMRQAKKRGIRAINGFDMLFFQGVAAFEIFTGTKTEANLLYKTYEKLSKTYYEMSGDKK